MFRFIIFWPCTYLGTLRSSSFHRVYHCWNFKTVIPTFKSTWRHLPRPGWFAAVALSGLNAPWRQGQAMSASLMLTAVQKNSYLNTSAIVVLPQFILRSPQVAFLSPFSRQRNMLKAVSFLPHEHTVNQGMTDKGDICWPLLKMSPSWWAKNPYVTSPRLK